jgi:8-oxoguanine deaminase
VVWPLGGVLFAGAHTDLIEGWLRCGPFAPRDTIINGRSVVRGGQLLHPSLESRLADHRRVARRWQAAALSGPK